MTKFSVYSKSRKIKESSAKANRRKIHAAEARKKRASFIFLSLGGSPIDNEYDPLIYGVQQVLKSLLPDPSPDRFQVNQECII